MNKFTSISVAVAIEPDGTRLQVYAAIDDLGYAWTATSAVGESPDSWERITHPEAPGMPDARAGTAARFWERAVEMVEREVERGSVSVLSHTGAFVNGLVEEWRRMYPRGPR